MKAIHKDILSFDSKCLDAKLKEMLGIKEMVGDLINGLEPELDSIIEKLGIFDTVNFKKSICRSMIEQIKSDIEFAVDKNLDEEMAEKSKELTAKRKEITNTFL